MEINNGLSGGWQIPEPPKEKERADGNFESYERVKDKYSKVTKDRDHWRTLALAAKEALEKMLSPELDWENGEIGVGNNFRTIARKALAAFPPEEKK